MIDIRTKLADEAPTILIGCVGYEARSIYHLQTVKYPSTCTVVYFDYASRGVLSYDENLSAASGKISTTFSSFFEFTKFISDTISSSKNSLVEVDITSFDREKLATLIFLFFKLSAYIENIRFIYCPSKFRPPSYSFDVVNSFGPVIPEFIGNAAIQKEQLSLIVGAGYEYGRIIGAIDSLEPEKIHCFIPTGTDPKFDVAVQGANLEFKFLEAADSLLTYDLNDPDALYYNLRRIIEIENTKNGVMILPLGPKLFAAISIVIATILHPEIMVWRHSTASAARPETVMDVAASGKKIGFGFRFQTTT